jgi:type II secretory ATPase GspE/PulE/Tfp pilus assembly ATPase PilB-like protein
VAIEAENCVAAISKWLQLVPDKKLALGNFIGAASTRLIRILCDECKEEYEPSPDILKKLNIPAGKIKVMCRPGEIQYTRGGKPILCDKCQSVGYYGRTAVLESFVLNEQTAAEIAAAESIKEMAAILRRKGVKFVLERTTDKLADGITSVNEMVRILKPAAPQSQTSKSQEALD